MLLYQFTFPRTFSFYPSTFHPLAQQDAFRHCDVGLKSRPFARWSQWLRNSPTPFGLRGLLTTYGAGFINPAAAVLIQFDACSMWR
jgi:hypothetical protein